MIQKIFYKHSICIISLLCTLIPFHLFADEICDQALDEGKQKYNAGQYQQAKDLFDFVQTVCGASYGNAGNWIDKCDDALTPRLSVSRTSISVSAASTAETLTVTSNRTWEVQHPSGTMYSVTRSGNTLTVRINENTSSNARQDYFNIKTTDGSKVQRISLSQSGRSSSGSSHSSSSGSSTNNSSGTPTQTQISNMTATIKSVTQEHNVYVNGKKGMRIYVNFSVNNMLGFKGKCIAWFADASNNYLKYSGSSSYTNNSGHIYTIDYFTPSYQNTAFSNFELFMPYEELHKKGSMTFHVQIREYTQDKTLTTSSWYSFTYGTENTTTTTLSVNKTSISASSYGTTEYITVTSNKPWDVQYPSGTMYSVTRSGNTLTVKINENTSSNERSDFFNIKTTDGSKVQKISLSQSGRSSSSSSKSSGNYYRSSGGRSYSSLSRFNLYNGDFEMFWWGISTGLGTAYSFETSAFAMRWSWFGFDPIVVGVKYSFIYDDIIGYYQPDFKFYFPWNSECAVTLAAGPSIEFGGYYDIWFKTELGIHWHYGRATSSNFFLRYDGDFMVGASIQFSTGW